MTHLLLIATMVAAMAIAGCLGDGPTPPTANDTPGDGQEADTAAGPHLPQPSVAVPLTIDGVSPSGIWLCAAQPVVGDCEIYSPGDGNDVHEIPHDGTVVAISLTLTYTPVTPEVKGIMMRLNQASDGNWTRLAEASGGSGTTITATDLNVTMADLLTLVAYTVPDADVGGAAWVELLPQDYQVSGELHVVPEVAR